MDGVFSAWKRQRVKRLLPDLFSCKPSRSAACMQSICRAASKTVTVRHRVGIVLLDILECSQSQLHLRAIAENPAVHISIPAPARGATASAILHGILFPISIPAPARGATHRAIPLCFRKKNFNSRPCARGDACEFLVCFVASNISIPAPARGATRRRR